MRYTVEYTSAAEEGLAAAYLQAGDPATVIAASHRIELTLTIDPRSGDDREYCWVLRIPPLEVLYTILEQDHIVHLFSVEIIKDVD